MKEKIIMATFCYRPSNSCSECVHFRADKESDREVCYLDADNEELEFIDLDPLEIKLYGFEKYRGTNQKFKRNLKGALIPM